MEVHCQAIARPHGNSARHALLLCHLSLRLMLSRPSAFLRAASSARLTDLLTFTRFCCALCAGSLSAGLVRAHPLAAHRKGPKAPRGGIQPKNRCAPAASRNAATFATPRCGGPQVDLPTPQGGNMPPPSPGSSSMMSGGSGLGLDVRVGRRLNAALAQAHALRLQARARRSCRAVVCDRARLAWFQRRRRQRPAPLGQPALLRRTNTSFSATSSRLTSSRPTHVRCSRHGRTRHATTARRDDHPAASPLPPPSPPIATRRSRSSVASHDGSGPVEPPKLTRSLTSYLKEISDSSAAPLARAQQGVRRPLWRRRSDPPFRPPL